MPPHGCRWSRNDGAIPARRKWPDRKETPDDPGSGTWPRSRDRRRRRCSGRRDRERSGAFAEPPGRIVFEFALARALGVRPFGEAENITGVDAGLTAFAPFAAFAAGAALTADTRISADVAAFSAGALLASG